MKIFILHYSKLTERKESILKQFQEQNIRDYEFIEDYDKDELTEEELNRFQDLAKSKISLILKHVLAYKKIAESYEEALILEDDVFLSDGFVETLANYMKETPKTYDMLFIGNGLDFHIPDREIVPGKHIYKKGLEPTGSTGDGASRCADSYIVSNKCAKSLCNYIKNMDVKIDKTLDFWINHVARDMNLEVYWAEPTIVSQGSLTGKFETSLNENFSTITPEKSVNGWWIYFVGGFFLTIGSILYYYVAKPFKYRKRKILIKR
jgi:GR25 family glycosyltransferase involved in LPS biosynthesis